VIRMHEFNYLSGPHDTMPGAFAHATLSPTGESHLGIDFADPNGQIERLDPGGYFESGYQGTRNKFRKDT